MFSRTIQWRPEYEVGVPEIDAQHRELFARINAFFSACANPYGRYELRATLDYLAAYVREHFADEEALHARHGYPLSDTHRLIHADLIRMVEDLAARLERAGPTPTMLMEANLVLVDWLVKHVAEADQGFGRHLAAKTPA